LVFSLLPDYSDNKWEKQTNTASAYKPQDKIGLWLQMLFYTIEFEIYRRHVAALLCVVHSTRVGSFPKYGAYTRDINKNNI
jgi:hypothetical protein